MRDASEQGVTAATSRPSSLPGAVVLVSYHPPRELFRAQLQSIRDQTRGDFRCIVAADGDDTETRDLVSAIVDGDGRFEVIGFPDNVGFYRNVERALAAVPADVGWIALSDQDDRWYPEKLERLVPLLDDAMLAMNQARVVRWPSSEVLIEKSTRTVVPAADLAIANQVTGSFSVFRRELLDVVLPFPALRTFTTFHDHWIGVCAAASGGYVVLDEALQDYVQHGSNIVGEFFPRPHRPRLQALRDRPGESLRDIRRLADEYEGGHSLRQCLRAHGIGSFGWRRIIAQEAVRRTPAPPDDLVTLAARLDPSSGIRGVAQMLRDIRRSPHLTSGTAEAFYAGIPFELTRRVRLRARPATPAVQKNGE